MATLLCSIAATFHPRLAERGDFPSTLLSLNDLKDMNHCTVEDASGNAILTFKHEGIKGIEVLSNNCSLDQQYDLARAGAYLAGTKTHQVVQTASTQLKAMGEQLGAISQGLANLAPEGTREKLASFQQQQVATVAKVLASSKEAIATVGQGRFDIDQSGGKTSITLKGVGTVFQQVGKEISTRMAAQDTQVFIDAGKRLAKVLTTARASGRD